MRVFIISIFLAFFGLSSFAQDSGESSSNPVKRLSVNLQAGFPSLTGVNIEYVLPVLKNKIALGTNVGYLPLILEDVTSSLKYFSFGPNYFFGPKSKVFYVGIDYGLLPISASEIEGNTVDYSAFFHTFNSKIGLKAGKNFFYKLELGYSLISYDLDDANEYLNETYGVRINPAISFVQLPNFTTGFGYRF